MVDKTRSYSGILCAGQGGSTFVVTPAQRHGQPINRLISAVKKTFVIVPGNPDTIAVVCTDLLVAGNGEKTAVAVVGLFVRLDLTAPNRLVFGTALNPNEEVFFTFEGPDTGVHAVNALSF